MFWVLQPKEIYVTILRHKFFTYKQLEGQSFHDFITEL